MRNREKALKLDLKYTLFLGISVVFVLISCVLYLNLQNQMTQKSSQIASLTSELATLTDANSAARERINSAVVWNMFISMPQKSSVCRRRIRARL